MLISASELLLIGAVAGLACFTPPFPITGFRSR